MPVEIKKFTETDLEFKDLARIDNLVNHDSISHPDDDKNAWEIRDKSLVKDRLLYFASIIISLTLALRRRDILLPMNYSVDCDVELEVRDFFVPYLLLPRFLSATPSVSRAPLII